MSTLIRKADFDRDIDVRRFDDWLMIGQWNGDDEEMWFLVSLLDLIVDAYGVNRPAIEVD